MTNDAEQASVAPPTAREGFFDPRGEGRDGAERLRDLEFRYRGLIDSMPAVIYVDSVDVDGAMLDVSPSVEGLLGISRDDFLSGLNVWTRTVHPDDLERVVAES